MFMNVTKKIVLAICLIASTNVPLNAKNSADIPSIAVGVPSGLAYYGFVRHTPIWAAIPGVVGTALAQLFALGQVRERYPHREKSSGVEGVWDDFYGDVRVTVATALVTALASYGVEKLIAAAQKKNVPQELLEDL